MTSRSIDVVEELLGKLQKLMPENQLGQYQGQIWMSDDFNDPLPDEFWLGEA